MEFLSGQPVAVTACVATEYGETLLSTAENLTISARRLAEEEMEDLISIGTIGLIKAISTFDSDKGPRLATYAARCRCV